MAVTIYETKIKYELWAKILLVFPLVLVTAMGIFFYNTYRAQDELAAVAAHGFYVASIILFATGPFILFIYWLVLPTKIYIQQDRIRIKYGRFYWNVRFETIESVKAVKGFPPVWSNSSVTSYRNQIEIVRKGKMNIRLSPENHEQFLDPANHALADWHRIHGS